MIAQTALNRPVDANGTPIFPNMEAHDAATGARLGRVGLLRTDGIFIVTGVNGQGVRLPAESIAVTWDLPRLDSLCDVCDAETVDAIEHEVPGTGGETVTLCPDCRQRDTIVNGVALETGLTLVSLAARADAFCATHRVLIIVSGTDGKYLVSTGHGYTRHATLADVAARLDVLESRFGPFLSTPPAADPYANIPAIGGGSHEADTATKPARNKQPRNQATSQKRDNQRAQRAALNEAYKAHAAGKASEVSDILIAFGFEIASTKDVDGTPVTIWHDTNDHATIKQTPYSLRIYNGQPARLPRHGDAELINRMEHGWCACGGATGYADGLAHAILRLIEVPDPYMQALDDLEAREAEPFAPELTPEEAAYLASIADLPPVIMPPYVVLHNHQRRVQCARCNDKVQTFTQLTAGNFAGESICLHCADILTAPDDDEEYADEESANAYTLATRSHEGGMQTIIAASFHDVSDNLPELVLHGGQPSMSGPWELPVMSGGISGGSQDADTLPTREQLRDELKREGDRLQGLIEDALARDYCQQGACCDACYAELQNERESFLASLKPPTADDYCVTGCERQATRWVHHRNNYLAYCDECAPCQHDADEPPARFCSQCGHDTHPDAPQPTDTGTSYDVPEIVESVFLAHEDARDEGEYRAIIAEQNRTAWDSINQQLDAMHDAAKQRMIDADAFIKQAGDARASALHGMLTANAHHFKPHARAYEAAMMDADAALTAARTIKRMTTSQDTELSHEDFAATLDALDALRLMGMRPAQSIIDRLLALRVFRAFYERHRTARKFTITTEERQNNRQAIGAPNITTARRIARNLTGCGITNSATIHEERANNTSILRETWHQAHKLTGDELTAFISPLAFA